MNMVDNDDMCVEVGEENGNGSVKKDSLRWVKQKEDEEERENVESE